MGSRLMRIAVVAWITCLILLGIVAHIATNEIEEQRVEEECRKASSRR